jgi:hypothetical protein
MIKLPDDVPNVPLLRWVSWIMLFNFEMKHVRVDSFKVEDALSQCPQAPTDLSYNNMDPEDFLDTYSDLIYSGSSPPPGATVTSSFKFLLSSVHSRLSSLFIDSWTHKNILTPVFHLRKAFIDIPKLSTTSFQPEQAEQTRLLPDFHHQKSYLRQNSYQWIQVRQWRRGGGNRLLSSIISPHPHFFLSVSFLLFLFSSSLPFPLM